MNGLPVASLAIDHFGNLWAGTAGGGVARISASGFSSFSERDGLGVRGVWAVFEDRMGTLMAVTKDEDHYFLNRFDGLENMQRRASALGGTARIESPAQGRGTHIVVEVPVTPRMFMRLATSDRGDNMAPAGSPTDRTWIFNSHSKHLTGVYR